MNYERCFNCGQLTGKAGIDEDSIFLGDCGPFCDECYDALVDDVFSGIGREGLLERFDQIGKNDG